MTDATHEQAFTQEEIRLAVNGEDPRDAMGMLLTLFQRLVIAFEGIHKVLQDDAAPQPVEAVAREGKSEI